MAALEPRFSYIIGRLDRALHRRLGETLAPHALTVRQYTTLSVLRSRSGLSNAQLARRSLMAPQSMNEVLAALFDRGLVRRTPDRAHGRVIRTELTADGVALLETCDRAVDALEQEMLCALGQKERERLLADLRACARALGAGIQDES
jgi:DNA-binding MarR family transcriptional regulator